MAPVLVRLAGGGVRTARKVDVTGVVRNARRLAQDARLLKDHERYASPYVLAIISFEEIGKMLIKLWGLPASKSHISKQLAVTSLLIANDVVKEFGPLDQIEKQQIQRVAKAVDESPAGRLSKAIRCLIPLRSLAFALSESRRKEPSSLLNTSVSNGASASRSFARGGMRRRCPGHQSYSLGNLRTFSILSINTVTGGPKPTG
jgi:AbiV family abortive infection protein